jgi:hypothetical protein
MHALAEVRGGSMPMHVEVAEKREGFGDASAKVRWMTTGAYDLGLHLCLVFCWLTREIR